MAIEIDFSLDRNLVAANLMNLYAHIVVNFGYSRHFFADRSVFIIYEKVQSRSIKNIEGN